MANPPLALEQGRASEASGLPHLRVAVTKPVSRARAVLLPALASLECRGGADIPVAALGLAAEGAPGSPAALGAVGPHLTSRALALKRASLS